MLTILMENIVMVGKKYTPQHITYLVLAYIITVTFWERVTQDSVWRIMSVDSGTAHINDKNDDGLSTVAEKLKNHEKSLPIWLGPNF